MPKRLIALAIALIAMTAAIGFMAMQPDNFTIEGQNNKQAAEIGVAAGKKLPEFALTSLEGASVKVGSSPKVTIINFWATWCPPCREEMPELEKFSRLHGDQVDLYTINLQEPPAKVTAFLNQNQYTLKVLLDSDGQVAKIFRVNSIPTTIVADSKGIIKYRKSGPVTASELEGVLSGL